MQIRASHRDASKRTDDEIVEEIDQVDSQEDESKCREGIDGIGDEVGYEDVRKKKDEHDTSGDERNRISEEKAS